MKASWGRSFAIFSMPVEAVRSTSLSRRILSVVRVAITLKTLKKLVSF